MLQEAINDEPDLELVLALIGIQKFGTDSNDYDIEYGNGPEKVKIRSVVYSNGEKYDVDMPIYASGRNS